MVFKLPETKQITLVSCVIEWLPEEKNTDLTPKGPHISLLREKKPTSRSKDSAAGLMPSRASTTMISSLRKASTAQVAALTGSQGDERQISLPLSVLLCWVEAWQRLVHAESKTKLEMKGSSQTQNV